MTRIRVPVDARTPDWPRKVSNAIRELQNDTTVGGSVTSVGLSIPTGFAVSGSPVTGSGTLALSFASGYSLPTDAKQTQWDTAYSWGNHATAGYLANLAEDTTPQLGGTLDANGNTIDMGTNLITDTKVGQWDTAYGWGDHASAGYLDSGDIGSTVQAYDAQLDSLAALPYTGNSLKVVRVNAGETGFELATVSGGVSDGDKGDITVSGSGATWTIDSALLQDIIGLSVSPGDIFYVDGSGDIVRLAKGTDDQVLTLASGLPSWADATGGGGGGGKVAEGSDTGVSSFDVDLPSGYTSYRLEYTISSISGNSEIEYVVTDDAFATVETGASDYEWVLYRYAGSFGGARDNADDSIRTVGGSADYSGTGVLEIMGARDSALPTHLNFRTPYDNGSPSLANGWGNYLTASDVNGVRVLAASGTFNVTWRLYAQ